MRLCMKTASTNRAHSLAKTLSSEARQTRPARSTEGIPNATSTEIVPTSVNRRLSGASALLPARSIWATQTAAPPAARLNVQIREGEHRLRSYDILSTIFIHRGSCEATGTEECGGIPGCCPEHFDQVFGAGVYLPPPEGN